MAIVEGMTPERIETVMTEAVRAKTEELRDRLVDADRQAAEDAANVASEASAVSVTAAQMSTSSLEEAMAVADNMPREVQTAVEAAAEQIKPFKGVLPAGTDANQVFGVSWRGQWGIDNSYGGGTGTYLNLPFVGFGTLDVQVTPHGFTTQVISTTLGAVWVRGQTGLARAEWTPWVDISRQTIPPETYSYRGDIPANQDWGKMFGTSWRGVWSVDNGTGNGNMSSWVGMPEYKQGTLVVNASNMGFTTQIFHAYGTGGYWVRSQVNIAQAVWTPWKNLAATPANPALEHDLRVNRARQRSKPRAVQNTALAVVLDHGTNVFNETLLNAFTSRNIPVTIALNGDMYNPDDVRYQHNNRTTWADVKRWYTDHGVEIANHGMTHGNISSETQQEWEVTESLKVLETNLPGVPIDSWVGPAGLPLVNEELGFMSGAGTRAMYAKHAVIVSAIVPQHWPLTGEPRVGMSRYWVDQPSSITSSKSNLLAVPEGHGTMVSFHPEILGQTGNSTISDIEGFLDWLVQQRDAGRFTLLTLRELGFATVGTDLANLTGTGFPEGKVSAPVGTIYTDTAATAGAIRWIKTSGTGNTGWEVEYGDTGWRNISEALASGVSGNVFVSRVGKTVNFMFHNVLTSSAGHITLFSLPIGFRPVNISGANWRNGSVLSDNGDTVRPVSYFSGNFRVLNMPTGKTFGGSVSLVAEGGWPSTLPGTPA